MMPNGYRRQKLDFLGTIRVYNQHYFTIWRRYNNVHEIVIEDFSGDFHYHKDYTIRQSIQKILCLSDEQMEGIYTIEAISYKHRADISEDVTPLRWTDIEHRWYALDMNLGGILQDFHSIPSFADDDIVMPPLEMDDSSTSDGEFFTQVQEPQIKQETQEQQLEQSGQNRDRPLAARSLSDRFAEVQDLTWTLLSSPENFMVLRNGTRIEKPHQSLSNHTI